MKKIKFFALALLPLLMLACSKDNDEQENKPINKYVVAIHNLINATNVPDGSDGTMHFGFIYGRNDPDYIIEVGNVYQDVVTEVELPSDTDPSVPLIFVFKLGDYDSEDDYLTNNNFLTANHKDGRVYGFYVTPNKTTHLYFYDFDDLYTFPETIWFSLRNRIMENEYGSWK